MANQEQKLRIFSRKMKQLIVNEQYNIRKNVEINNPTQARYHNGCLDALTKVLANMCDLDLER